MRIMLDTNVLISVVIFNSKLLKDMLIEICDKHSLVLSSYVIDELGEVVNKKFPTKRPAIDKFLYKLPYELVYTPNTILEEMNIEIRDKKDIPVIYSAIISDVDILITGDKDFKDLDIEKPEILTPSEYMEKYN